MTTSHLRHSWQVDPASGQWAFAAVRLQYLLLTVKTMVVCIVRPQAGIGRLLLIDMLRCADGTNQGLLRGVECGIHAECLEVLIQRCEVLGAHGGHLSEVQVVKLPRHQVEHSKLLHHCRIAND